MDRTRELFEDVETLWRERFGQPPPIRTDPCLLRKILRSLEEPQPAQRTH